MHATILVLATIILPLAGTPLYAQVAYSVDGLHGNNLHEIDLRSGEATFIGHVDFWKPEGLAFIGNTLYGIASATADNALWNLTCPPGTRIGEDNRSGFYPGLSWDPTSGVLYDMEALTVLSTLYSLDPATGTSTEIGVNPEFLDNLAIDCNGHAFAVDAIYTDSLYSIDLSDGSADLVGPLNVGDLQSHAGLTFVGNELYLSLVVGEIYIIDPATGQASLVAETLPGFYGLAAPHDCIPRLRLDLASTTCPQRGPARLTVSGASGDNVVFFYSLNGVGQNRIPDGFRCAGTIICLASPVRWLGTASGNPAVLDLPDLPAGACGQMTIQAIDVSGCETTNKVRLVGRALQSSE